MGSCEGEDLNIKESSGFPWLYMFIGFLVFKSIIYEIGLLHQYYKLR